MDIIYNKQLNYSFYKVRNAVLKALIKITVLEKVGGGGGDREGEFHILTLYRKLS